MPIPSVLFFIFIAFIFGTFVGIVLAYVLKQWKDEERILEKNVDEYLNEL